jgi:hypothetical protein
VGQMILGTRPITEKTIAKAEAIRDQALPHGAQGWFDRRATAAPGVAEPPRPYESVPPEYRQLLDDLSVLAPSRRSAILDQIHPAAEEAREIREQALREVPAGKVAAARRPQTSHNTTAMTWGDGNRRQASLPLLVPTRDPFTAAPSYREAKFYERVEQAPKAAERSE